MARSRVRDWRWLVGGAVLFVVCLLIAFQITLPGIASSRLRAKLELHGPVQEASVSAFPAIELLWGHAGSVTVRMSRYRDGPVRSVALAAAVGTSKHPSPVRRVADFLASTSKTGSLDARVGVLQSGRVVLDNVVVRKQGGLLYASALVTEANLDAALPPLFTLRPVRSGAGGLILRGKVNTPIVNVTVTARLLALGGAVVIEPESSALDFLRLTVFKDRRIFVESIASQRVSSGWTLTASARLVG